MQDEMTLSGDGGHERGWARKSPVSRTPAPRGETDISAKATEAMVPGMEARMNLENRVW